MNFSSNSSMVMGSMCVGAARGTCAEKAETEAILNPDSGLVDRLMLCSWQQRSKVNFTCTAARMIKRVVTFAFANVQQTEALVLKCCRVR